MPRRKPKVVGPSSIGEQLLEREKHALIEADLSSRSRSTPADQGDSRDAKVGHRWHKGMKPMNPEGYRGTMRKYVYELMTLARGYAPEAFVVLRRISLNPLVNPESRIKAAVAILDRAFGPPNVAFQVLQQQVNGPSVNVQVNQSTPGPKPSQESELARMAAIAKVLQDSGALAAIAGLEPGPKQVESIPTESNPIESAASNGESSQERIAQDSVIQSSDQPQAVDEDEGPGEGTED